MDYERNRFRRNTRQFKIFPTTPITRRIPNIIVRYCWIRARISVVDDMFVFVMSMNKRVDKRYSVKKETFLSTVVHDSAIFFFVKHYTWVKKTYVGRLKTF